MMFENIINYLKNIGKKNAKSKETAKERLQLVLTQDRANVSADYLDLMKQEIIEVIKKYINIDEAALEVELTKPTEGVPSLIANIPILSVKSNRDINKKETNKVNNEKIKSNNVTNNNKTNTQKVQNSNQKSKENTNQSQKENKANQNENKQTTINSKTQKINNQEEKKNENKPKQKNNNKK